MLGIEKLDNNKFAEQMVRLEASFHYSLPLGTHQIWREELERNKITDDGLKAGMDYLLSKSHRFFPNVTELIRDCKAVMIEEKNRQIKEKNQAKGEDVQKKEEQEYSNELAKDCVALAQRKMKGEISEEEFNIELRALAEKHPTAGFEKAGGDDEQ